MRQRSLRLLQRRLVWPRVDLCQEVALVDDLAFLEADFLQLPVDLCLYRHGIQRGHRPKLVQHDTNVAGIDRGKADRLWRADRAAWCWRGMTGGLGLGMRPQVPAAARQSSDDETSQYPVSCARPTC